MMTAAGEAMPKMIFLDPSRKVQHDAWDWQA